MHSARKLIGLPVVIADSADTASAIVGVIESVTIHPETLQVDGFLVGRAGHSQQQAFLPRECVIEVNDEAVFIHNRLCPSNRSRRILGLSAWTTTPRVLVGFVHDLSFSIGSGLIEFFVVNQFVRKWHVPPQSVERITPKALLISRDATVKLKLTPFPEV